MSSTVKFVYYVYYVYIYIYIYIYIWRLTKAIFEMKCDTEETMKLELLYKVSYECELNSWPDSSVS